MYYKIWNDPSVTTPNVYCVSCGRKIMEANRDDRIRLRHEIQFVPLEQRTYPRPSAYLHSVAGAARIDPNVGRSLHAISKLLDALHLAIQSLEARVTALEAAQAASNPTQPDITSP